jgi:hypothetical protein
VSQRDGEQRRRTGRDDQAGHGEAGDRLAPEARVVAAGGEQVGAAAGGEVSFSACCTRYTVVTPASSAMTVLVRRLVRAPGMIAG